MPIKHIARFEKGRAMPEEMKSCPICGRGFRQLIRRLSKAGKTFKLATQSLPPPRALLQLRTRRQRNWRDGSLLEGKDGKIYWEYWEKNILRLRGVNPGDQWQYPQNDSITIVQEYREEGK